MATESLEKIVKIYTALGTAVLFDNFVLRLLILLGNYGWFIKDKLRKII